MGLDSIALNALKPLGCLTLPWFTYVISAGGLPCLQVRADNSVDFSGSFSNRIGPIVLTWGNVKFPAISLCKLSASCCCAASLQCLFCPLSICYLRSQHPTYHPWAKSSPQSIWIQLQHGALMAFGDRELQLQSFSWAAEGTSTSCGSSPLAIMEEKQRQGLGPSACHPFSSTA